MRLAQEGKIASAVIRRKGEKGRVVIPEDRLATYMEKCERDTRKKRRGPPDA